MSAYEVTVLLVHHLIRRPFNLRIHYRKQIRKMRQYLLDINLAKFLGLLKIYIHSLMCTKMFQGCHIPIMTKIPVFSLWSYRFLVFYINNKKLVRKCPPPFCHIFLPFANWYMLKWHYWIKSYILWMTRKKNHNIVYKPRSRQPEGNSTHLNYKHFFSTLNFPFVGGKFPVQKIYFWQIPREKW